MAATRCRSASNAVLGGVHLTVGQPERCGRDVPRAARTRSATRTAFARAGLVIALMIAGAHEDAMAAANGLIDVAEATGNP